jgi:hypothetical protein
MAVVKEMVMVMMSGSVERRPLSTDFRSAAPKMEARAAGGSML